MDFTYFYSAKMVGKGRGSTYKFFLTTMWGEAGHRAQGAARLSCHPASAAHALYCSYRPKIKPRPRSQRREVTGEVFFPNAVNFSKRRGLETKKDPELNYSKLLDQKKLLFDD